MLLCILWPKLIVENSMTKNRGALLCPSCGQLLIIEKIKTEKSKLRKNTQRTTMRCSRCGKSIKEVMQNKFNKNM